MKLTLLVIVLCTVGSTLSEGMELAKDHSIQKIPSKIQHIPQDVTISILGFVDYPTLAQSRQVCKLWKTLIDEKLPLPQRYILKYLAQFVQKNTPERTIKRFGEIFLAPLSDGSVGKTVLDDIIDELEEDLSGTKEQAYQDLLNCKLISTCPSITLKIYTGVAFGLEGEFAFPYIPANLMKQDSEHAVTQDIKLTIRGQRDCALQIFGIGNLPTKVLDRVTQISLHKISLLKIPRQLQKLQRLTAFTLNNSKLSSMPAKIGQLTNLQRLSLINNQLSSISDEIGQLTNLQGLYLNNNQMSSIPAEIGQLTNLQALVLSNNELSSIPDEIGQLSNLQTLYLQNNQLSNIPPEIGQLSNLRELYLSNNQLSSIPAEIGQLTKLQRLYLDQNQLSSVPAAIEQLKRFGLMLSLDNNPLNKKCNIS